MARRKHEIPDDGSQNSKRTDKEENYGDKADKYPRDSVVSRQSGNKPRA